MEAKERNIIYYMKEKLQGMNRKKSLQEGEIQLGYVKVEEAKHIYSLMRQVQKGMGDPSLFVCDDLEYVLEHVNKKGFIVKAENSARELVASFLIRYPKLEEDNLGYDLGFSSEKLEEVAHMESVVVREDYRGSGIQQKMLQYAEKRIREDGYRYCMATVAPGNVFSKSNFLKQGYECKLTKLKYGGKERDILLKVL